MDEGALVLACEWEEWELIFHMGSHTVSGQYSQLTPTSLAGGCLGASCHLHLWWVFRG